MCFGEPYSTVDSTYGVLLLYEAFLTSVIIWYYALMHTVEEWCVLESHIFQLALLFGELLVCEPFLTSVKLFAMVKESKYGTMHSCFTHVKILRMWMGARMSWHMDWESPPH